MSSQLTEEELAALMPSELCQVPDPDPDPDRRLATNSIPIRRTNGSARSSRGCSRWPTTSAASRASIAAVSSRPPPAWPPRFVAMNQVYGPLFDVTPAEAATPAMADERANALKDQFIMDMHTHFLRDDTRITTFVDMRKAVGKAGWNKELSDHEQTIEDLKFNNYKKEMFLDSDTKIALISSAPSDIEQDWFLTNEQMADARARRSTTRPARGGCSVTPSSRRASRAGSTSWMRRWR